MNVKFVVFCLNEVVLETHVEHSNKRSLQKPDQHVAPMVLVIRDSGVTDIHRKGHQEELDGGPEESGPLSHQPRLHVQLKGVDEGLGEKRHKRERERKRRDNEFIQGFILACCYTVTGSFASLITP